MDIQTDRLQTNRQKESWIDQEIDRLRDVLLTLQPKSFSLNLKPLILFSTATNLDPIKLMNFL